MLPPKWVFPFVIADSKNVISGAPFGPGKDSPLWADFKGKIDTLNLDAPTKTVTAHGSHRCQDVSDRGTWSSRTATGRSRSRATA